MWMAGGLISACVENGWARFVNGTSTTGFRSGGSVIRSVEFMVILEYRCMIG